MTATRRVSGLLALLIISATPALADPGQELRDFWERVRSESRIESRMVLGTVRGLLASPPLAPDWTPRSHGKGRLERGPGGLPILYLEGTPEEMGEQHGVLLKREIQALLGWYIPSF